VLRITRLTDYAIVVLGAAAEVAPLAFAARTAAEQTGLPLPAVKKILKSLVQKGVVESQRGTSGGYRLSRPATQIALADIIDAIEGPFALTSCGQSPVDGQRICEYLKHCGVHSNWSRVNGIVRRALASVTLADMIGPGDRGLVSLRVRPRGAEPGRRQVTGTSTRQRESSPAGRAVASPRSELGRE
jgi:FeS assembly SUF system regulator